MSGGAATIGTDEPGRAAPGVFVSFSVGGDLTGRNFVRRLLARLADQPLDPWIYESPGGEIPLGQPIAAACKQKIDDCRVFLALVTRASLASYHVATEVEHALSRQGRLVIVPLIGPDLPGTSWPAPFSGLAALRGFVLDANPLETVESIVEALTTHLGVPFSPERQEGPRFPLRRRVMEEVSGQLDRQDAHHVARFHDLVRACDLAARAYEAGDIERAERRLVGIELQVEDYFPGVVPYYQRIVAGIFLLERAKTDSARHADARDHFARVLREVGPRADANAYVGLANAQLGLGEPEAALRNFMTADAMLDAPDPASFHNIVRASVLCRRGLPRAEIERRARSVEAGMLAHEPGSLSRHSCVLALAFAHAGAIDDALQAWERIPDSSELPAELVVDLASAIAGHDGGVASPERAMMARRMLDEYQQAAAGSSALELFPVRHLAARLEFDAGDPRAAIRTLDRLVEDFPAHPIPSVDLAMYAIAAGMPSRALQECRRVLALLSETECVPSLGAAEFNYALGQAFWLTGNRASAEEALRRSGYPDEYAYASRLADWYGRAR